MAAMMPAGSSSGTATSTVVQTTQQQTGPEQVAREVVRLKLSKPATSQENRKKVSWTQETVDNENMGKKKSKCCCVYVKPREFDESSGEESNDEDGECENCSGHVEAKRKPPGDGTEGGGEEEETPMES